MISKPMRDALGIDGPTELELTELDGRLELELPYMKAHRKVRDGLSVIVPDEPVPPVTTEMVRAVLERVRK